MASFPPRLTFPPGLVAYYQRLTARERVLSAIMGGAVLFIVNLVLLSVLLRSSRELGSAYAEKSQLLSRERLFAKEKDSLWVPREAWLKKTQPPLTNPNVEGYRLLETVQGLARGSQVIVTNPTILPLGAGRMAGEGSTPTDYQAVTVKVTTQSDWLSLVRFITSVQQPTAFLVFDDANLRTEPNDPKRMIGEFTISKWFAPAGK